MKLDDILYDNHSCEIVYCTQDGEELLDESAIRQYKRSGDSVVRKFRCMAGPKKGKLVSNAADCGKRKEPRRVRQGRKTMRMKKGVITRKTRVTKRRAMSKVVARMNKRLMGTL